MCVCGGVRRKDRRGRAKTHTHTHSPGEREGWKDQAGQGMDKAEGRAEAGRAMQFPFVISFWGSLPLPPPTSAAAPTTTHPGQPGFTVSTTHPLLGRALSSACARVCGQRESVPPTHGPALSHPLFLAGPHPRPRPRPPTPRHNQSLGWAGWRVVRAWFELDPSFSLAVQSERGAKDATSLSAAHFFRSPRPYFAAHFFLPASSFLS